MLNNNITGMKKKILLIATGGTIASKYTDRGLSPQISGEELLHYIPEAKAFLEGKADLPRKKTMIDTLEEKNAEIARLKEEIEIKNRVINALLSKAGF